MHRIPQLTINRQGDPYSQKSDSAIISNPIRIGLFQDGAIFWKYPCLTECRDEQQPTLSIMSMNCSSEYEMIKFCLTTNQKFNQNVKVVVQYQNLNDSSSTAFYCPSESAIVSFSGENQIVSLIGGSLNGKPMKEFCIHDKEEYNHKTLQDCLRRGRLRMSWLATGNVCSTFTFETVISSELDAAGVIWIFHSNSEETVKYKKKEMTSNIL